MGAAGDVTDERIRIISKKQKEGGEERRSGKGSYIPYKTSPDTELTH